MSESSFPVVRVQFMLRMNYIKLCKYFFIGGLWTLAGYLSTLVAHDLLLGMH